MDWNASIENNREALKRVLAMLVAMAGGATLPRHLHRAVLRLLRPAEAAARRLVIVTARGLVVTPPRPRLRKPEPASSILRNGVGTGILMPPGFHPQASSSRAAPRTLALPLFDRLRVPCPCRPAAGSVPRISAPGYGVRVPVAVRRPLLRGDPIDASRLLLRLQALASALDDLPRHARRFARWQASRKVATAQNNSRDAAGAQNKGLDAAGAQNRNARRRFRRVWPLRPGRPPGWCRRPTHDVHDILNVTHGLAIWALQRPDTS